MTMDFLVDTHAHIYLEEFQEDRDDMLRRANEKGVKRIYMPNVDHTSIDGMLQLEMKYPGQCFPMMGLHPCYVKSDFQKELYLVEEWLSKRRFSAVGEIGTDLYWDKTFWEQQQEAFRTQVSWAKKYDLPVVIHCRESIDETISLVEELKDEKLTGIFHCFSGNAAQAKKIIEMNFYLGIGGVATFKKGGLDTVLPETGLDKLVLETDSPYLAPVPFRGKRNEPAYVSLVAVRVAEILKLPYDEVQRTTTENALKIFGA
jgi:TatD DNase family protein